MRRAAPLLAPLALAACSDSAGPVQVSLPEDTTAQAVLALVDFGAEPGNLGEVGARSLVAGARLEVEHPERSYLFELDPVALSGIGGPELVFASLGDARDGMDSVRFPVPIRAFTVDSGRFVETDMPAGLEGLRIPCASNRAATRPSFEENPDPICPAGQNTRLLPVITCRKLLPRDTEATTAVLDDGARVDVQLEQAGCRFTVTCAQEGCEGPFPLVGVLPPTDSGPEEEALTLLEGDGVRCDRAGSGEFRCEGGAGFTLE